MENHCFNADIWNMQHLLEQSHKKCIECDMEEYMVINYGNYILDSQTIDELLGLQQWIHCNAMRFRCVLLKLYLEGRYRNIENAEEKQRRVRQAYDAFVANYSEINMN
jgi:hypothetical protein